MERNVKIAFIILCVMVFSQISLIFVVHAEITPLGAGFSGYIEPSFPSTYETHINDVIDLMIENNCTLYRISFNPEWFSSKPHPYTKSYITYFLDNAPSNFTLIIDRNHVYPPTQEGWDAVNWTTANASVFEILDEWGNNTRVAVELINEYGNNDYYSQCQSIITSVRNAGYQNALVMNKWNQNWQQVNDPINNTYQGYHYYFDYWSVSGAQNSMLGAKSAGINKLINTEIGASSAEYSEFTSGTCQELQDFLEWSYDNQIMNCVWLWENNKNWENSNGYEDYDLNFSFIENNIYPNPEEPETPEEPEDIEEEPEVIAETTTTIEETVFTSGSYIRSATSVNVLLLNQSSFAVASDVAGIIINVTDGDINGTLASINVQKNKGHFYINNIGNATFTIQPYSLTSDTVVPAFSGGYGASISDTNIITASCVSGNTIKFSWNAEFEPLLPFMFIFGVCGLISFIVGVLWGAKLIKEGEYEDALVNGCILCGLGFGLIIAWLVS